MNKEQMAKVVKEVFDNSFKTVEENLSTKYAEVNDKMSNVEKELAVMKMASLLIDEKTGIAPMAKVALGNSVKQLFGVKLDEKAVTLVTKADANISGSVTGDGAELMGVETHKGIIRLATEFGVIPKFSDNRGTSQRTYRLVKEGVGADSPLATIGGFDDELANRDSEKLKFTADEIKIKKWRRIVGTSQEAIEDSEPEELGAYIMLILAESVGIHSDKEGFDVLSADANVPVLQLAGNAFTWDELIDAEALVRRAVLGRSAYFFNRKSWGAIKKLKDGNGLPLITAGDKAVMQNVNFAGGVGITAVGYIDIYPVYIVDDRAMSGYVGGGAPNDVVGVFGDLFNAGAFITRKGFSITESHDEKFSEDIVLVKGVMRKRYAIKNTDAVTLIKRG